MIVTIDGPAGAGKSSVAKELAKRLGYRFIDTGAMYRVVALAGARSQIDFSNKQQLAELAANLSIAFDHSRILLNGQDVTQDIRKNEITLCVRLVADNVEVRTLLVELQRQLADGQNVVSEGRDQGTVAFPNAQCKIFLTASAEERARRRMHDLQAHGEPADFDSLLEQQNERDRQDAAREVGRLIAAPDAIEVFTDGLTQQQVVDRLEEIVCEKKHQDQQDQECSS